MTASLVAALAAAGLLGVTHAVEPDHVAGLSALTSEQSTLRRSALAGASFALGHVGLVVVWVAGGYLVLGRATNPQLLSRLGTVGVGVLLGLLAAATTLAGLRRVVDFRVHEHGNVVHRHPHLHVPPGPRTDHDHGVGSVAKTGLIGALFTLSPPLTMIAFSTTLFPRYGPGVVALAVGVYAVAIVGTMGLIGAGVGLLFGLAGEASRRARGALQVAAGLVLGAVSLALLGDVAGVLP